jgi:hypothetical protein
MVVKNIALSSICFLSATIITWWFIEQAELLYFSPQKMLLSCGIAGGKWGIQIVASLLFLKEEKWEFISLIALTCLLGSCLLLPYCLSDKIRITDYGFLISLIVAVLAMTVLYYKAVRHVRISQNWFYSWICCLVIAVSLQVFVVFKIL